ncbi:hypothetical protein BJN45_11990 [Azonexus hydrophilus]|uniref:DOMON-like domain-containing protein n=1 Tax=Azonexus hydrophilus TaxID=418702 RepID=A0A1R1I2H2_9RHOO|nr:DOMON-like domain-containing protein [Azonexus hydrophilus]OMG52962.1 hypothetical protein BJN45_11990 [Azonexus hydrophilus]
MSTANFHPLQCHATGNPPAGLEIHVSASRADNGDLHLTYRLHGAAAAMLVPPPATPGAADGLWQHTCCEAFIAAVDGPEYREFNFSPSGQWAIYDFADYRQHNTGWHAPAAPRIDCSRNGDSLLLSADIPAALLPAGAARLGLTVVAETAAGDKTYWALTHAGAQPDFHLAASFTLPLP